MSSELTTSEKYTPSFSKHIAKDLLLSVIYPSANLLKPESFKATLVLSSFIKITERAMLYTQIFFLPEIKLFVKLVVILKEFFRIARLESGTT